MTSFFYVDDDDFSRQIMEMLLTRQLGYSDVTILEDSTDIIKRVEALPEMPDIFLLDIHMHPHNGFEVLKMLRAHPTTNSKPVIALTASVMNEEIQLLREAGFDGVIAKPINMDQFPATLDRIMAGEKVWRLL